MSPPTLSSSFAQIEPGRPARINMRSTWFVPIIAVLVASLACAKRVPRPADVPPGTPLISWIIMHGDADNPDREFACQSTPRSECALPASTQAEQVFSHVYLYYHGAGAETSYAGSVQIGFFRGAAASGGGSKTNITVKKDESLTNQSTTGIVTSTPGSYALTIAFDATTSTGTKQAIRDEVRVAVQ
jgi:hypothetical protein